jgi:hypothetical protein
VALLRQTSLSLPLWSERQWVWLRRLALRWKAPLSLPLWSLRQQV